MALASYRNWAQLAAIVDRMVLDAIDTEKATADILKKAQARADKIAVAPVP